MLYLDEILSRLEEAWNTSVFLATLQHALIRLNLTQKTVSKQAQEQNDYLHAVWEGEMAEYDNPDCFLFLDESAVNNLTTQQCAGWSPHKVPCVHCTTFLCGVHYSILPVLTMDGMVALDIFEGSVNQEWFLGFLREQIVNVFIYYFCWEDLTKWNVGGVWRCPRASFSTWLVSMRWAGITVQKKIDRRCT